MVVKHRRTGLVSIGESVINGNVIMCALPTLTSHLLCLSDLRYYYYYYYHHHHYHRRRRRHHHHH